MTYNLGKFKTTDVFLMATLLSKIGIGKIADTFGKDSVTKLVTAYGKKKGEDLVTVVGIEIAMQLAQIVLTNLESCKGEMLQLLANVSGMTVNDIESLDAEDFMELLVEVVQMPQFKDFIKVASKLLG